MILLIKGIALALNALTGPSAHVSTVVNFWPVKLSGLKISFTRPSDKMSDDF
jgi:hypothetical protein